jgi:undecaprenyl-diphosphatase
MKDDFEKLHSASQEAVMQEQERMSLRDSLIDHIAKHPLRDEAEAVVPESRITYIGISLLVSVIALLLFASIGRCVEPGRACAAVQHFDSFFAPKTALPRFLADIFLFITYLAEPTVVLGIGVVVILVLALVHERRVAALVLSGFVIGDVLAEFFKSFFLRIRPPELLYLLPRTGYSFPSGHAIVAMVFYGFMGYCLMEAVPESSPAKRRLIVCITALIVFLIGASRVILGYHYASDVVGGWLLGGAVLSLLIAAYHTAHISWKVEDSPWGRFSHGLRIGIIAALVIFLGFWVIMFYITHPIQFVIS